MEQIFINCLNTGEEDPETGKSWISNYHILRKRKGLSTSFSCIHCDASPVEGCHVRPRLSSAVYIVPMCHDCNTSLRQVRIDDFWAEPVNEVSEACS